MPRILIIDDTINILEELRDILEMEKFEVITAVNAMEGLTQITSKKPDLIITDLLMPGISGLELIRKIRSSETHKDIPIIVLSANADTENIAKAKTLKADSYLKKPCASGILLETINDLIK